MIKFWAVTAILALGGFQQTEKFVVRVAGNSNSAPGIVVASKDYVSLTEMAELIGAKLTTNRDGATREITLTPSEPKTAFDDTPDTAFSIEAAATDWVTIAGSNGKLRVRDFTRSTDSWVIVGDLEVARQSILAQGRVPSGKVNLEFYITMKGADGKTIGRTTFQVKDVSYDGGRYPIQINTQNSTGKLPANFTLRFNSANEPERGN